MNRCLPGYNAIVLLLGVLVGVWPSHAGEPGVAVKGVVLIDGEAPVAREWKLEEAMQRATGEKVYRDETWLVGEKKGLANCVVTLKAKMPAKQIAPKPLENVVLDKVGVRFVPRVLIVTPGTEVTLRNKKSPCRGFQVTSSRVGDHNFNCMIDPGLEKKVTFRGRDICPLSCPIRSYARGFIMVVDTPYFAATDDAGRFNIKGVPAGDYQVTIWHEATGRLTKDAGPIDVTLTDGKDVSLSYRVRPPADSK